MKIISKSFENLQSHLSSSQPTCCGLPQKLYNRIIALIILLHVLCAGDSTLPHRRSFWLMQSKNTFSGLALLSAGLLLLLQNLMFSHRNDLVLGCTAKSPAAARLLSLATTPNPLPWHPSTGQVFFIRRGEWKFQINFHGIIKRRFFFPVDDTPD